MAWQGLELRHLTAFRAVTEERSFSAAAQRLGYTQSAISNQVRDLERCVGTRLLERTRGSRNIHPTRQGRVLYRYAVAILDHVEHAAAALS
jgi:DNA-binding transcriptional LysR family regulator